MSEQSEAQGQVAALESENERLARQVAEQERELLRLYRLLFRNVSTEEK